MKREECWNEGSFGIPWRALSSENSRATSSNLEPDRNLAKASSFFECFSHYILKILQCYFRFLKSNALCCSRGRKEKRKDICL